MTTILSRHSQLRYLVACIVITLCQSSSLLAQEAAESPEVTKVKRSIAELYCRDNGHLAECVGLPGNDCVQAMMPVVNECYPQAMNSGSRKPASIFYSCFSGVFNRLYGKKMRLTEDCAQPSYDEEAVKLTDKDRKSIEEFGGF